MLRLRVPLAPPYTGLHWVRPLPRLPQPDDEWVIDGSLFDEPRRFARRTGIGIALIGPDGSLLACAHGAAPPWIEDAAGAELWALAVVLSLQPCVPRVSTDCKGILDTVLRDEARATRHCSKLARTWRHVLWALDGSFDTLRGRLRWIPAHVSGSTMRHCPPLDSTGVQLTAVRWRANRLVDVLAKKAAAEHRLPPAALSLVSAATEAVRHSAALLGLVTHGANNYRGLSASSDGCPADARRDSSARKAAPRRPAAPGPPAQSRPPAPPPAPVALVAMQPSVQSQGPPRPRSATAHAQAQADLNDARQLHRHLSQLHLRPPPDHVPASERLQQLRLRMQARQPGWQQSYRDD